MQTVFKLVYQIEQYDNAPITKIFSTKENAQAYAEKVLEELDANFDDLFHITIIEVEIDTNKKKSWYSFLSKTWNLYSSHERRRRRG